MKEIILCLSIHCQSMGAENRYTILLLQNVDQYLVSISIYINLQFMMLSCWIVVIIYLSHHVQSQSYTLAQQFHTNLFSDDDITNPANPWTISGANTPIARYFTDCSGDRLFGGYGVLSGDMVNPSWVQKTWSNLPPHYEATISMKIYKIDSWSSDSLFIMVDGVPTEIFSWDVNTGTSSLCGEANPLINTYNPQYNEYIQTYSQTIAHFSTTLSLKLISSLKSWTGSWGVRELTITLSRCHLSCLACANPTACTVCDTANGLVLVGQFCECSVTTARKLIQTGCPVSQCVTCISISCPTGYYNFNLTSCASCNPACATCIGPGSLSPDCTSCNPQGYFDPGTGVCTSCYGFCASCTGALQNQCLSCQYGTYLSSNRCTSTCPSGTYGSQAASSCLPCLSPCATCDGSSSNHCLSCLSNFYLYKTTCSNPCPLMMYGYNGVCLASCPLGTYPDTTTIPLCISCPAFCETCDQTGNCISCVMGAFFSPYDNLCHSPCPGPYYGDTLTMVCAACDPSCLTCWGPTSGECSSCFPSTFLVYSTCYSICPPHTYSIICQLCHQSCLNCTGPSDSECTSCNNLQMLHLNSSKCLTSCLAGDIADNIDRTCITCPFGYTGSFKQCVTCNPTCLTCSGELFTDCTDCVKVAQHHPDLFYNYNSHLDPDSVTYFSGVDTCVYRGTPIIYMPTKTNTSSTQYSVLVLVVIINLALALMLECLFKYKTNLLLTLETMQMLSYLYYFSTPFSESNQISLFFLFNAHPTLLIQTYSIFPSLSTIVSLPHYQSSSTLAKTVLMNKTNIFIADAFYFHIAMLVLGVLFVIIRMSSKSCGLYSKMNPYLLTYSFRLLFMEFAFNAILFFTFIRLDHDVMKWSLAFVIIDIMLIAASFFWKIRTQMQPNHAHYALFYFNQLGPPRTMGQYQELTQAQEKQRKSILPSLVYYISRIPLAITIILFSKQPLTQSICLLIYSIFLLGINIAIQFRRKIYRALTLFTHTSLVLCAGMMVGMCYGADLSVLFDLCVLLTFSVLLFSTFAQTVTNYQFFSSILDYALAKFCGKIQSQC